MKSKDYLVVGCGNLGKRIARVMDKDYSVTTTATTQTKLEARRAQGFEARLLKAGEPDANYQILENADGCVICIAPSCENSQPEDNYRKTFETDLSALVEGFKQRNAVRKTHITYISSTGVYGDQFNSVVDEQTICDLTHPVNRIMHSAEENVLSLSNTSTTVCVLRLGGLFSNTFKPLDVFKGLSGKKAAQVGKFSPAWVHVDDAAAAVKHAFDNQLEGIYNANNNTKMSYREIGDKVCESLGVAPIIWAPFAEPNARISNARVSNQKLKSTGFEFSHPTIF